MVAMGLVALGAWLPYQFLGTSAELPPVSESAIIIKWQELRSYDYKKKHLPEALKTKLESDESVRISGFAVPLEVAGTYTNHFLFVPTRAYCIHVPPPPPHLMIEVRMKKSVSMEKIRGPLIIEGRLELKEVNTEYGDASWYFEGHGLEVYPTL